MKPRKHGISRLIAATRYSAQGYKAAWQHEEAFRQEAILAALFIPAAFFIGDTITHTLLLIICCALVILAELLNSAIEAVVDRISDEHHELSGRAKDIGSAAVLTTIILFIVAWGYSLLHWIRNAF